MSPWRIVEMRGQKGVHGRRASRTLKLLPGDYFTGGVRYLVFLDWKLSLQQHPSRTRHRCETASVSLAHLQLALLTSSK